MSAHDWSRFILRIPINAGIAPIYDAWITQAGLETWFLRKALFYNTDGIQKEQYARIEKGDRYEWWWHGYSDEVLEKGTVLNTNGKDHLEFTFGKAGNVRVTVKKETAVSMLELEQYNIPTDDYGQVTYHIGCTKGWLFYLTNLKSMLEGGIDLRNRDLQTQEVVNS